MQERVSFGVQNPKPDISVSFVAFIFLWSVCVWQTLTAMSWLAGYLVTTYSSTMQN